MIIINYLLLGLIWLISRLPFSLLYFFSDINFFFIYHVFGYRRKVVRVNLCNSFPEKSDKEIVSLEKKFYHHLCDLLMEILKIRGISKKQLLKRVHFKNTELLDELYEKGKSIIAVTGHLGNWEWTGMALPFNTKHKVFALVKPLSNEFLDKYMYKLRTRFAEDGPVPFKQAFRVIVKHKNIPTCSLLASDQTPTKGEIEYWTTFMNQETPVFLGTEKMARALNFEILFFPIRIIKRGYYEVEISKMFENPKGTVDFEITEKHTRLLEEFIFKNPENWLWSHRRWKHKRSEIE